jgi:hypothetical protein
MSVLSYELVAKRFELLKDLVPSAGVIAYLTNPTPSQELELKEAQRAARALQIQLHVLQASREQELDSAFAELEKLRAHALVVASDPFLTASVPELWPYPPDMELRRATLGANTFWMAASSVTGRACQRCIARRASIPAGFSEGRSRPTYQSRSRPDSIWR